MTMVFCAFSRRTDRCNSRPPSRIQYWSLIRSARPHGETNSTLLRGARAVTSVGIRIVNEPRPQSDVSTAWHCIVASQINTPPHQLRAFVAIRPSGNKGGEAIPTRGGSVPRIADALTSTHSNLSKQPGTNSSVHNFGAQSGSSPGLRPVNRQAPGNSCSTSFC